MKRFFLILVLTLCMSLFACEQNLCKHSWKDATCTEAKTCTVCAATEGDALGHSWKDATCTEAKTCTVCAATEGEMLGHTWGAATCTEAPKCSVCGIKDGNALGHTWIAATCTKAKTCSVCQVTEGTPVAHAWAPATCVKAKTCTVCYATEGYPLSHVWAAATCVKPKTCTVCNATEGRALGHAWSGATTTKAATCTENGINSFTCVTCGSAKTENIPQIGHSFNPRVETQAATCSKEGAGKETCKNCGFVNYYTIPKTAHDFDENLSCRVCKTQGSLDSLMTAAEKATAATIQYVSGGYTTYNESGKKFSFELEFKNNRYNTVKVPAVVEIVIVNDNDEVVYSSKKIITQKDFSYGNKAKISISQSEIKGGSTRYGDVYVTVYNPGYFSFDAIDSGVYELPVKPITIHLPALPQIIHEYNYSDKIDSSVRITEITYAMNGEDSAYIYLTGEKTYDAKGPSYSQSAKVGWKLYDANGYIVDSGTFYSPALRSGEKFRNEEIYVFDVVKPGGVYYLEILSVD